MYLAPYVVSLRWYSTLQLLLDMLLRLLSPLLLMLPCFLVLLLMHMFPMLLLILGYLMLVIVIAIITITATVVSTLLLLKLTTHVPQIITSLYVSASTVSSAVLTVVSAAAIEFLLRWEPGHAIGCAEVKDSVWPAAAMFSGTAADAYVADCTVTR